MYAFSENFILPLSHDEVVHGKGSLLDKMPGDRWQQLANLRALYAYMWAHPGKKLLFMGGEFAPGARVERTSARSTGTCSRTRARRRCRRSCATSTTSTATQPALWERRLRRRDGFRWLEANDADANVLAFVRCRRRRRQARSSCVCNLSPVPREGYRVGLPRAGRWREVLNTDAEHLRRRERRQHAAASRPRRSPWHGQPFSAELTLPPLGVVWLVPERLAAQSEANLHSGSSKRPVRGCRPGRRTPDADERATAVSYRS